MTKSRRLPGKGVFSSNILNNVHKLEGVLESSCRVPGVGGKKASTEAEAFLICLRKNEEAGWP